MSEIFGRQAERQRLARMLTRYTGGVMGYYGMSGLGKSTVLDLLQRQIAELKFTPYVARLDFADPWLHDPGVAFVHLIEQLEATGATRIRKGILRRYTSSPLDVVLPALLPQADVKQVIQVRGSGGSTVENVTNIVEMGMGNGTSPMSLSAATGKFKLAIAKLPIAPSVPKNRSTNIIRPLVILMVDTLEQAPDDVLHWIKRFAEPMFQEFLLLIAAGQEHIEGLLTTELNRVDDAAIRDILAALFDIVSRATSDEICQLARGIPRCAVLAGQLLQQDPQARPTKLLPDDIKDHLVADYLIKHILKRLPDSSVEKHLLTYGCVLRRWENTEQLRNVLFGVPQIQALIGSDADIRAALNRLNERSFLDTGEPQATLRDLLLHDLQRDEPACYEGLQRCAADDYLSREHYGEAVYHLLALGDWRQVIAIWRDALAAAATEAVRQILVELKAHTIPQPYRTQVQIKQVESGLLLERRDLLPPLLVLLEADLSPEDREQVNHLLERGADATFIPAEMRYRLAYRRATTPEAQASALRGLGEVLRLQAQYAEARAAYEEARELCAALDDRRGRAYALRGLVQVAASQGDSHQGLHLLDQLERHLLHPDSAEIAHAFPDSFLMAQRAHLLQIARDSQA